MGLAGPTLVLAAMTLLWLAALTWLLWPWIRSRLRAPARPHTPLEHAEPTSVELLRQRYVLGQIDAFTFEEMIGHVLVSQVRERDFYRTETLIYRAGTDPHRMSGTEGPRKTPRTLEGLDACDGSIPSQEEREPHAQIH